MFESRREAAYCSLETLPIFRLWLQHSSCVLDKSDMINQGMKVASPDMESARSGIGRRLRETRKQRGLTLKALGKRTGYSASALSKMENERLGLTYDKLTALAIALDVDLSDLFSDSTPRALPAASGRRSIAREGSGKRVPTKNYDYHYISPELRDKQMVPMHGTVQAKTIEEFGPLVRHGGEEWIYVLKGEVEVHSEFYAPELLKQGDSIYIDSRMGHAYLSKSHAHAEILAVCTAPDEELGGPQPAALRSQGSRPAQPRVARAKQR
jgi:transcriptional regulator with XRE-family HTH domain